jgi:hypothetical protein
VAAYVGSSKNLKDLKAGRGGRTHGHVYHFRDASVGACERERARERERKSGRKQIHRERERGRGRETEIGKEAKRNRGVPRSNALADITGGVEHDPGSI